MKKKTVGVLLLMVMASIVFSVSGIIFGKNLMNELSEGILTVTGNEAKENSFFGVISRTKYLDRWGTSINCEKESLNDHLVETARIAHMLVLIKNKKFGGNLDPERAAVLAMYHDVTEIITDDMPTPIKYGHPQIKPIYNELDEEANSELLSKMPEEFRDDFDSVLNRKEEEQELWQIVKYADEISALTKCLREKSMGNKDFDKPFCRLEKALLDARAPEVEYFMRTFLPAYNYTYPENK